MTAVQILVRYTTFVVLAMVLNLATQRGVLWLLDGPVALVVAIAMGTTVGLIVKYLLDKRWVFADVSTGLATHTKKFGLYTLFGGFTTAIFWGSEVGFWIIYRTDIMREIGAIIGLTTGYVLKYQLDKWYVFRGSQA